MAVLAVGLKPPGKPAWPGAAAGQWAPCWVLPPMFRCGWLGTTPLVDAVGMPTAKAEGPRPSMGSCKDMKHSKGFGPASILSFM
jgi:hypothetical protein